MPHAQKSSRRPVAVEVKFPVRLHRRLKEVAESESVAIESLILAAIRRDLRTKILSRKTT